MYQQNVSLQTEPRAALSFAGILAWGGMLATLLVVTYACLLSPEGAVRVRMILQGAEVILLTLAAGAIAGTLHFLAHANETRRNTVHLPAQQQTLTA